MSSQKLNSVDREDAKEQIYNHFLRKYHPMPSAEDVTQNLCSELEGKHSSILGDIRRVKKELNLLKSKLEKKLPQHFSIGDDLNIFVMRSKKDQVSRDRRYDIEKKNRSVEKAEQRQLAKLQVIGTRSELETLYKSLGIL